MENRVNAIPGPVKIKNVILTTANKDGLDTFVSRLLKSCPGAVLYSTGGTYRKLREIIGKDDNNTLRPVSEYTGQPEMQGGLVKTLDYKIYLGLLSEPGNDDHRKDLERAGGVGFDMVVVNLYPFKDQIKNAGITIEDARAFIDIGGPCMIRAAAKNFLRVAPVCNPEDYETISGELERGRGAISLQTRFRLAKKAFAHTAAYDREISDFLFAQELRKLDSAYTVSDGAFG